MVRNNMGELLRSQCKMARCSSCSFNRLVLLQKRIGDLKKERKTVESQVALAEDELRKTEDLVKMLSDSKKVRWGFLTSNYSLHTKCLELLPSASQTILTHRRKVITHGLICDATAACSRVLTRCRHR